ncbi:MAG: CRISPR-associated endonuclease Cas1, partial [Sinobacteraceae bacterium]|nr:CRISPR-associated endonuclease Cas1 [Nevskiaceae bacterium]
MVVIDQRGARLGHQAGALIVRMPKQPPRSIPLNLINQLVLAAAVEVQSTLFTHLAERGIGVVIMPGRGHRRSMFLYGAGHGDAARRLGQYHLVSDPLTAHWWARRFVAFKLIGGARLLRRALARRPDCRHGLTRATAQLRAALIQARRADNRERLRGIEGAASAAFLRAYRALFPVSLEFFGRNRRPPRDPVNAALSLGYTLAHGDATRAIAHAGLDPMLGFLHEAAYSRESLACDFVELARPRIEHLVWRLFAERQLRGEQFTRDG